MGQEPERDITLSIFRTAGGRFFLLNGGRFFLMVADFFMVAEF